MKDEKRKIKPLVLTDCSMLGLLVIAKNYGNILIEVLLMLLTYKELVILNLMFANVFRDNFVDSAVNGRAYNNYINDRPKASKDWDNRCEITISDVE